MTGWLRWHLQTSLREKLPSDDGSKWARFNFIDSRFKMSLWTSKTSVICTPAQIRPGNERWTHAQICLWRKVTSLICKTLSLSASYIHRWCSTKYNRTVNYHYAMSIYKIFYTSYDWKKTISTLHPRSFPKQGIVKCWVVSLIY